VFSGYDGSDLADGFDSDVRSLFIPLDDLSGDNGHDVHDHHGWRADHDRDGDHDRRGDDDGHNDHHHQYGDDDRHVLYTGDVLNAHAGGVRDDHDHPSGHGGVLNLFAVHYFLGGRRSGIERGPQ
jgi:hypothetical protein